MEFDDFGDFVSHENEFGEFVTTEFADQDFNGFMSLNISTNEIPFQQIQISEIDSANIKKMLKAVLQEATCSLSFLDKVDSTLREPERSYVLMKHPKMQDLLASTQALITIFERLKACNHTDIQTLQNETSKTLSCLSAKYLGHFKKIVEPHGSVVCHICKNNGAVLYWAGKQYHASCINLWLNKVDTALPE